MQSLCEPVAVWTEPRAAHATERFDVFGKAGAQHGRPSQKTCSAFFDAKATWILAVGVPHFLNAAFSVAFAVQRFFYFVN